jgi:hypothetical protein
MESLIEIGKEYIVICYTASHQSYADSVLNYLDPEQKIIRYRLYRNHCVKVKMEEEFIYVKDLRILKNVDLTNTLIVDNSVLSFAFHLSNGIPILPYYDNKNDIEFKFLVNYLKHLACADIRTENRKNFKLHILIKRASSSSCTNTDNSNGNISNVPNENNGEHNNSLHNSENNNSSLKENFYDIIDDLHKSFTHQI